MGTGRKTPSPQYPFLFPFIMQYKNLLSLYKHLSLIHIYATASSIADAANQIIGRKVFDAIDMPLDMQMSDITGPVSYTHLVSERAGKRRAGH